MPFAKAIVHPARRSAATASMSRSRVRIFSTKVGKDDRAQLVGGNRGGPALHDDDAPGVVGEARGLFEVCTGGKRSIFIRALRESCGGPIGAPLNSG